MQRVRVFVDFWNFQAGWNDRAGKGSDGRVTERPDWTRLPVVVVQRAGELLATMGTEGPFSLEETIVHASIDKANPDEDRLGKWLSNFLDRQPSFNVRVHERRARPASIHCQSCRSETNECPKCGTRFMRSIEKGVDTALATDLLTLGFDGAYDVGLLVSSDADFVPAVRVLLNRGIKIIDVAWPDSGHELKKACWADIDLAACKPELIRT